MVKKRTSVVDALVVPGSEERRGRRRRSEREASACLEMRADSGRKGTFSVLLLFLLLILILPSI
ncbi:hypothetical protein ACE6H2_003314 [Prunus campanulata]